jgi:hypothetical protein
MDWTFFWALDHQKLTSTQQIYLNFIRFRYFSTTTFGAYKVNEYLIMLNILQNGLLKRSQDSVVGINCFANLNTEINEWIRNKKVIVKHVVANSPQQMTPS